MNGTHLFSSPPGQGQLSPRSHPQTKHNPRTDPFYSPGDHSSPETSPYTSAIFSPDDMMHDNKSDVQFEKVNWDNRNNHENRKDSKGRTITPTREKVREVEHTETINLTPPMGYPQPSAMAHQVPKPAYYAPPMLRMPTPPAYQGVGGGLGIQYPGEKGPVCPSTPPSHIYPLTPSQNTASWEPTQPPASHYNPNRDFQDVELNRPATYASSSRTLTEKHYEPVRYYRESIPRRATSRWLLLVYIIIFLIGFVGVPLAIFGGVYHWNYGEYRCNRSWGTWHQDTSSCTY